MQKLILLIAMLLFGSGQLYAQEVTGRVLGEGSPLKGANIHSQKTGKVVTSNNEGKFAIASVSVGDSLIISYVGFQVRKLVVNSASSDLGNIILQVDDNALSEVVVNTGYYQVPKERATGSFEFIDNLSLNRSVGTNILERLEGIANGVQFSRTSIRFEDKRDIRINQSPDIRVRGLSTIEAGSAPLIIIDNFPYDGDIENINPNDVENVTILKDAAAASIWGARAGNGVIVITTKKSRKDGKARVSYQGNVNITGKPDLFYNPGWLPSGTVMEIQEELFKKKIYPEQDQTQIPAYVELLILKRENKISNEDFDRISNQMRNTDFRKESLAHLYQQGIDNQHSLNISGGDKVHSYQISAGYDKGKSFIIGDESNRFTVAVRNEFTPFGGMEISTGIWLTDSKQLLNGLTHSALSFNFTGVDPYARLVDDQGVPLVLGKYGVRQTFAVQAESIGLLDWTYNPLLDRDLMDNTQRSKDLRLTLGLKQKLWKGLDFNVNYQYQYGQSNYRQYYHKDSYFVHDLVNRYTAEATKKRTIPHGGILDLLSPKSNKIHSVRGQLNYNMSLSSFGELSALGGLEVRKAIAETSPSFRVYNHSDDILGGSVAYNYLDVFRGGMLGTVNRVPVPSLAIALLNNHDLSYYSNLSYIHLKRYVISSSLRWDGSNLFGVKANQKGTPLWSIGGSWQLSDESFYGIREFLPYLRLRATYGSAGNVDKSQSAYPTISMGTNPDNDLLSASLSHPGNPALRWERVNTTNFGLDWRSKENRISGSFEYYKKQAHDLLGTILMDPTTGLGANYKMNYADMDTQGVDVQIQGNILRGQFQWVSNVLFSSVHNKVVNYQSPKVSSIAPYFSTRVPQVGRSLDVLYALPWNGLSSVDGMPIIYDDGAESRDYRNYYNTYDPKELLSAGVSVAPYFSSLRNTFSWKNIQLDIMLSARWGHVFRRTSFSPGEEIQFPQRGLHRDYFNRWKNPGDELKTNVPAKSESFDDFVKNTYSNSYALIEKGDIIRLNDVNLSYTLPRALLQNLFIKQLRVYGYARNLGVVWQASKLGLDPDYPNADYPAQRTYAIGLQVDF